MDKFFKFLGFKFRLQMWKDDDNKVVCLGNIYIADSTHNFWEEMKKK